MHGGTTTGTALSDQFKNDLDTFGFDMEKVVAIVTDTTGNMNTFGRLLEEDMGTSHLYCVCHNLHLCAKKAFKSTNLPDSDEVMKKAREICEYFCKSTQAMNKLKNQQQAVNPEDDKPPLKILQDVQTRWWSTWRMINRLL